MGDDHQGDAQLPVQLPQQLQDGPGGLGVQGRGGLVAEQHPGLAGQGPGDGHPLLLPAGELHRIGAGLVRQLHQLQQLQGAPAGLRPLHAGQLQGEADVFQRRALHQQVKALEDHADGFARLAQLPGGEGGEIPPVHQDLPLRWPLQQIDAAHQGALARPGQADNAEDLSVLDA